MKAGCVNIVIGGQAGSEAKGKAAAYLAERYGVRVLAMSSSPNAGHTVVKDGHRYVTHHLPAAVTVNPGRVVVLTPASVVRPQDLLREVDRYSENIRRLVLDYRAAVITDEHLRTETEQLRLSTIGSTTTGVGAARAAKLLRVGRVLAGDVPELRDLVGDSVSEVHRLLEAGESVLFESTQGFDLCLEHGIDPLYCTSRLIHPAMALAELGVKPRRLGTVWGVIRPYPIRVNNRDGFSGPYPGAQEITWEEVARRAGVGLDLTEYTTTTKLPRRVFTMSWARFDRFVRVCGPNRIVLQFANYLDWRVYGKRHNPLCGYGRSPDIPDAVYAFMVKVEHHGPPVTLVGTGPEHHDMIDLEDMYGEGF